MSRLLFEMVTINAVTTVKRLLAQGNDPDAAEARDIEGCPLVYKAAELGHVQIMELLLAHGVNVNACFRGLNPLFVASQHGNNEIVALLLNQGVDANEPVLFRQQQELEPLANQWGHAERAELLHGDLRCRSPQDEEIRKSLYERPGPIVGIGFNSITPLRYGSTSLFVAVLEEHVETVESLLSHGADVEAHGAEKGPDSGYFVLSPLSMAAENGNVQIGAKLLAYRANVNARVQRGARCNESPLYIAIHRQHVGMADLLLAHGANVEERWRYETVTGREDVTPLLRAAQMNDLELVECLLEYGANVEARDDSGATPLHAAVVDWHGQTPVGRIVDLLLERRSDINARDEDGKTPLVHAIRNAKIGRESDLQGLELLLERGADINARDKHGRTPLVHAIGNAAAELRSNLQILELLLEWGADVNIPSAVGWTPIQLAIQRGEKQAAEILLKYGSKAIEGTKLTLLHETVCKLDAGIEEVERLLAQGIDPNSLDENGRTPLHEAVKRNYDLFVELLLVYGANPSILDLGNTSPLFLAESKDIAEMLLAHGADFNVRDPSGKTALHSLASSHGLNAVGAVYQLLDRGSDPNALDNSGETPLFSALKEEGAMKEALETVTLLLEYGADVNVINGRGLTPLHYAVTWWDVGYSQYSDHMDIDESKRGHEAIVRLLLDRGAEPNAFGHMGQTPLHLAAKEGHCEVVQLLLKYGADPRATDKEGRTPLHEVSRTNSRFPTASVRYEQTVKLLLNRGADPNAGDGNGVTALHEAAAVQGNIGAVQQMLIHGADPNSCDCAGQTPLHASVSNGWWQHAGIVRSLLDHGADPNVMDRAGQCPLHVAARNPQMDVVELLLCRGANPEARDQVGDTPLHYSLELLREPDWDIVRRLLEHGADTKAANSGGETPTHSAERNGYGGLESLRADPANSKAKQQLDNQSTERDAEEWDDSYIPF